jgi:hypothetical protein
MTFHAQQPPNRRHPSNYSDRQFDWLNRQPDVSDDAVLAIAYAISEWAIDFVGPLFWICLLAAFLAAEFGN